MRRLGHAARRWRLYIDRWRWLLHNDRRRRRLLHDHHGAAGRWLLHNDRRRRSAIRRRRITATHGPLVFAQLALIFAQLAPRATDLLLSQVDKSLHGSTGL